MQPTPQTTPFRHKIVSNSSHNGKLFIANSASTFLTNSQKITQAEILPPIGGRVRVYVGDTLSFAAIDMAGHDARVIN